MRTLPTLALALLSLTVFSCSTTCEDPEPETRCYSGVIVGDACLDGILVEVDPAYPIGKPVGAYGDNVVAAVNVADFAGLNQVGQRVYFTYRNDPARQSPSRFCTANTAPLPVPRLVLNNLGAAACAAAGSR